MARRDRVSSTADRPGLLRLPGGSVERGGPPAGTLIGRQWELAALRQLVDTGARLVTLTGPPGVGKTRLAFEAAETLRPAFADGCVVVSLALARDAAEVPGTIAHALGLSDATTG